MPELHYTVRWPDGALSRCYSPSTTVKLYFDAGAAYPLEEFLQRSRRALHQASERVRTRYGYACSSALGQLQQIEATAAQYAGQADARVTVLRFEDGA
jgi:uncharacterized repeat protein (TIGR04042 family)